MSESREQYIRRVMSGEATGFSPSALRALTAIVEPIYRSAIRLRNWRYDRGGTRHLPRPVISVGNITTGGTGKTPVVAWLYAQLRQRGMHPAILMRGYKSKQTGGDEQHILQNSPSDAQVIVHADPDRVTGGQTVLSQHPEVDVFLLDDGFQHRRLARDFDLVLIDASNPFGYDHIIPRGMLREPMDSLHRANAILLTRINQVSIETLHEIEQKIRRHNAMAPIYHASHVHTGLRGPGGIEPTTNLTGQKHFLFCGIGNPQSLLQQVRVLPGESTGHLFFPDHHAYTPADVQSLKSAAQSAGAQCLLTTQKDWVKLQSVWGNEATLPVFALDLELRFEDEDGQRLLQQMLDRIAFEQGAKKGCTVEG